MGAMPLPVNRAHGALLPGGSMLRRLPPALRVSACLR